jgi:hypothetical protein
MLELIVAPNSPPSHLHSSTGTPRLKLDQFHTVIHILYKMGEGIPMPYDGVPTPDKLEELVYNITVSDGIFPGSNWNHHQLKCLNCWPAWHAAEKERLDVTALSNIFGNPELRPTGDIALQLV